VLQGIQVWHVLMRITLFYLPLARLVYKWNEPLLAFTPRLQSFTHFDWYLFPILLMVEG